MYRSVLFWVWLALIILLLIPVPLDKDRDPAAAAEPIVAPPALPTVPTANADGPSERSDVTPPAPTAIVGEKLAATGAAPLGVGLLDELSGVPAPAVRLAANRLVVEAPRASVRAGPSDMADEIATLALGTKLDVLERGPDGWVLIYCSKTGTKGYMALAMLAAARD